MGALRRVSQKGHRAPRGDKSRGAGPGAAAGGNAYDSPCAASGAAGGRNQTPSLAPGHDEVLLAVESLYADELKPFGRILRKRIAERAVGDQFSPANEEALPDVDIKHLRNVCNTSTALRIVPEEGGDWSAMIVGRQDNFVNVYSPIDVYPAELWDQASAYFESLSGDDISLPGGRYSCAQALVARNLQFLEGRSLGQVCHIVQLAISQKRILGYYSGAVVPYSRSQSMVKEWCAFKGAPCTSQGQGGASTTAPMPLATWEEARNHLKSILQSAATPTQVGMVPLSNVKRLFRSRFQIELSETMLGYSKLSELLQDAKFKDICTVQLQGHGYIVVQNSKPSLSLASALPDAVRNDVSPRSDGELKRPAKLDLSAAKMEPARVEVDDNSPLLRARSPARGAPHRGWEASPLASPEQSLSPARRPRELFPPTPDLSPDVHHYHRTTNLPQLSNPFLPRMGDNSPPSLLNVHGGEKPFGAETWSGDKQQSSDGSPRSCLHRTSERLEMHAQQQMRAEDVLHDTAPAAEFGHQGKRGRDGYVPSNEVEVSPSRSTRSTTAPSCGRSETGLASPSMYDEPMKVNFSEGGCASQSRSLRAGSFESEEIVTPFGSVSPKARSHMPFAGGMDNGHNFFPRPHSGESFFAPGPVGAIGEHNALRIPPSSGHMQGPSPVVAAAMAGGSPALAAAMSGGSPVFAAAAAAQANGRQSVASPMRGRQPALSWGGAPPSVLTEDGDQRDSPSRMQRGYGAAQGGYERGRKDFTCPQPPFMHRIPDPNDLVFPGAAANNAMNMDNHVSPNQAAIPGFPGQGLGNPLSPPVALASQQVLQLSSLL